MNARLRNLEFFCKGEPWTVLKEGSDIIRPPVEIRLTGVRLVVVRATRKERTNV